MVASFIDVLSDDGLIGARSAQDLIDIMQEFDPQFMDDRLKETCRGVLLFELRLQEGQNYVELFGMENEPPLPC